MVKKLYLLLFAMAISSFSAFAQCSGWITLVTQSDVDAFASRGCSAFDGYLGIVGINNGDITNLDSLYRLEHITGGLVIDQNPSLTTLRGLHNLKTAGGVSVSGNPLLTSLDGLESLQSSGEQFLMQGGVLTDISALENLTTSDAVVISEQQDLISLNGLQNLTSMKRLALLSNEKLSDLSALRGSRTITGSLELSGNPLLSSLSDLEDVHFLATTDIQITGTALTSLAGLNVINSLGMVTLTDNSQLSDLSALASLTSLDRLIVNSMPMLTSLEGFSSIATIGDIILFNNSALVNLHGFHNITTISRFISISQHSITDLSGLDKVVSIGHLNLFDNPNLISLNGVQSLKYLTGAPSVPDTTALTLARNPVLKDISALSHLTSLGGTLRIEQCDSLKNIHGLEGLASVDGGILFFQNRSLQTLDALSNVTSIGVASVVSRGSSSTQSFSVNGNAMLKDLGIRRVQSMPGSLRVASNPALENLDDLRSLEQVGVNQQQYVEVVISGNEALLNVDSLSSLRSIRGSIKALTVEENPLLTKLCGLYAVISEAPDDLRITIESNGKSATPEQIVADGPCSNNTMPQPGPLLFTNVTDTTMTVSFDPGSIAPAGGYVLILQANNSPYPDNIPANGNEYHVGQLIGNSTIVVGEGSGHEFHIVYLSPSTTYHFALFSFDSQLNYTEHPVLGSQATPDTAQPGPLMFTNVTDTTMTVSFDPGSISPTGGYLLLLQANNSPYPDNIPVNGNEYHVGQLIGNSTIVVGEGSGHEFHIVYLSPSTTYHFALFSFDSQLNYTAHPVLGSQATPDNRDMITQPANLTFSDITDSTMTVSFTASANESVDGYITVLRAQSSSYPGHIPADGTAYHVGDLIGNSSIVVGMGPATDLYIVDLSPDTDYWFDVYSFTNDGGYHYLTTGPLEGMQRSSPASSANAYPNPFVGSVTIGFTVGKDYTHIRVMIYDNMGIPVVELLNGTMSRGKHEVLWNGADSSGNKARSGLYHYSIIGHESHVTGTVVAK